MSGSLSSQRSHHTHTHMSKNNCVMWCTESTLQRCSSSSTALVSGKRSATSMFVWRGGGIAFCAGVVRWGYGGVGDVPSNSAGRGWCLGHSAGEGICDSAGDTSFSVPLQNMGTYSMSEDLARCSRGATGLVFWRPGPVELRPGQARPGDLLLFFGPARPGFQKKLARNGNTERSVI